MIVLSVDEKSQIQALDRTQPILPLRPGLRENNKNPRPFQWVASANTIVRKVRKYKWTLETGD